MYIPGVQSATGKPAVDEPKKENNKIIDILILLILGGLLIFFGSFSLYTSQRMAWFSHGEEDNHSLVTALKNNGIVKSKAVERAMVRVDRAHFVDNSMMAYIDSPSSIGYGATISAPHMHAYALELLKDQIENAESPRILDVGSGSGYLAACFAIIAIHDGGDTSKNGIVVGIEHIPELMDKAKRNLAKDKELQRLLDEGLIKLIIGDGRMGWPQDAPYHAIHVGAAAPEVPPALIEQLALGGRMVIPVGPDGGMQTLAVIDKQLDGSVKRRDAMGVMYVPLTHKDAQLRGSRV